MSSNLCKRKRIYDDLHRFLWQEEEGNTKMEYVVTGWIHSLALQKLCTFPKSLFIAKKHNPKSYTFFPFGKKKVHNWNASFQMQKYLIAPLKVTFRKGNKSMGPVICRKNLKMSLSYLWPIKYPKYSIRQRKWLEALQTPWHLPRVLYQLSSAT